MNRRLGRLARAFTVIELVLACALIVFGILVFFSIFSSSSKHATQTRNRTVAHLIMTNMLEEFEAHTYGAPEPKNWSDETDTPTELWIKGDYHEMKFHKKVEYLNSSFVNDSKSDNNDVVTVTITWREGVGDEGTDGATTGQSDDNKELQMQVPVWR